MTSATSALKLVNPEVAAARTAILGNISVPPIPIGDVENRRFLMNGFFDVLQELLPAVDDVDVREFTIKAQDGHELLARWYTKEDQAGLGSAVMYCHGGGMIALSINQYDAVAKHYVSETGVPFLMLDYRLAPEFQAPTQVTDMYAGLNWLHFHAAKLGVDPNRIAIMGDNAGGGITASLAHYVKAQGGPKVAKQILVYPMLDDRNDDPEDHERYLPVAPWTINDNITGWQALLGEEKCGGPKVTPIEAPARATPADVRGLPSAYIDVGELDIFREESLQYASVLAKGGVSCEFHLMKDVFHAYDALAPGSEPSKFIMERRYTTLRNL